MGAASLAGNGGFTTEGAEGTETDRRKKGSDPDPETPSASDLCALCALCGEKSGVCFAAPQPESHENTHERPRLDFRYDLARRRTGLAGQLVGGTKDPHRAPARAAQGRRHRSGISHFVARRLHLGRDHRQGDQGAHHLRPGPRHRQGHPVVRRGRAPGQAAPHPHLPRHLDHSPRKEVAPLAGRDPGHGRAGGEAGAQQVRRRAVLGRGRRPHRARLSVPGGRDRHQERGRHGQHSRHRRLHHARDLRLDHRRPVQPRAQHRQGGHRGPLPQRPGPRHREFHHRGQARRAPGGMHHQRHRRARGQRRPRRGRDDHERAPRLPECHLRRRHHRAHALEPAGARRVFDAGAAQQGRGRQQRLRAFLRHPPGRHAQGQVDLRDHDPAIDWPARQQDESDQPLGQSHGQEPPAKPRLPRAGHRP